MIVPGAWHPASCYKDLETRLKVAGYPALTTTLRSLNPVEPSTATCVADVEALHQQFLPIVEEGGQDVILICHSYGGIPGGGAARGFSKTMRGRQGKQGGIIGMVYISAFVVPEGVRLVDFKGRGHSPYFQADKVCFM